MALRVNVGCGQTPTSGWRNFDNSLSLRLSKTPILPNLLAKLKFLEPSQYEFIRFAREHEIEYGDATKGLPVEAESCDVLYSSHMLEHLDRSEVEKFLREALRVLCPGGIIRIAVSDIEIQVAKYNELGDADVFIEGTHLCVPRPRSLAQRLRLLSIGTRHHQWMYDGDSLVRLLRKNGFVNAEAVPADQTRIRSHEPLKLSERLSESVYVEAEKPRA